MRTFLAIALAVVAVLGAGCSAGGGSSESATTDSQAAVSGPVDEPAVGEALRRFVDAAANGDVDGMWQLLSTRSREQLGPTQVAFADEYAGEFQRGVGAFAGTPFETVLSVTTESGWGVAAIAGDRTRNGELEFAAYGAAFREEDGAWRIELGDPVRVANTAPGRTADPEPNVQVEIAADASVEEAGLWLDGEPLPGTVGGQGDAVTVVATPAAPLASGWHVLVIFGRAGDAATAGATPFQVEGAQNSTV